MWKPGFRFPEVIKSRNSESDVGDTEISFVLDKGFGFIFIFTPSGAVQISYWLTQTRQSCCYFGKRQILPKMPWVLMNMCRRFTPPFYQPIATQGGFDYKALKTWNNFSVAQFHSSRRVWKEKWSLAGFSDNFEIYLLNSMWLSYL